MFRQLRIFITLFSLITLCCSQLAVAKSEDAAVPTPAVYTEKSPHWDQQVDKFIDEMVEKHEFDKKELQTLFSKVTFDKGVIESMTRPLESKPWDAYKQSFITQRRIDRGVAYMQKHQDILKQAEKHYGVPAEIIVAVIGVETGYGRAQGKKPAINAISTLAFNYPPRAKFFRKELEHLLLLSREYQLDPLKINSSYAGAIGLPQFMPSSYRHYAASLKGNHSIDLTTSHDDAISSVGNFLKRHGWKRDGEVAIPAEVTGDKYKKFVRRKKYKPNVRKQDLSKFGITAKSKFPLQEDMAAVVELTKSDGKEFWLGFHNYYVLSRYNHSKLYIIAVFELSRAIEQQANLVQSDKKQKDA